MNTLNKKRPPALKKLFAPLKSTKFLNAQEAWLWYCSYERINDKHYITIPYNNKGTLRPCSPLEIKKLIIAMLKTHRLTSKELKVLCHYGMKNTIPRKYGNNYKIWNRALAKLEKYLIAKEIVNNNKNNNTIT